MPRKMALVVFDKCCPQKCENGICVAVAACPRKLIKQEAPFEIPMPNPAICRGCGDCSRACPAQAIIVVSS